MPLRDHIARVREAIPAGRFVNEAAVCTGIVLPILQELGWPVFDPQIVAPEYTVENRRVDYALCHPRSRPAVFVEVKQPGRGEGADRQLFEYAFHQGVPTAVLTDGQEWHFYLPAEQGHYQDRRVYKLDLLERDIGECEARLQRYLAYSAVCSGAAITAARADYQNVRRAREVDEAIPLAWRRLLEGQDELLIELLSDQVESLCGYKPEPDTVGRFLVAQLRAPKSSPDRPPKPTDPPGPGRPHPSGPNPAPGPTAPAPANDGVALGFSINGVRTTTRNARDTLLRFLEAVAQRDPSFLDRFAALPKHGRRRRFIARTKDELYPGRPDLARDHSHELQPGWWVGTNYSAASIRRTIEMACDVAGLVPGRDVRIFIGD